MLWVAKFGTFPHLFFRLRFLHFFCKPAGMFPAFDGDGTDGDDGRERKASLPAPAPAIDDDDDDDGGGDDEDDADEDEGILDGEGDD